MVAREFEIENNRKETNNRLSGIVVSIAVHALLLLLLFFYYITPPNPPYEDKFDLLAIKLNWQSSMELFYKKIRQTLLTQTNKNDSYEVHLYLFNFNLMLTKRFITYLIGKILKDGTQFSRLERRHLPF